MTCCADALIRLPGVEGGEGVGEGDGVAGEKVSAHTD